MGKTYDKPRGHSYEKPKSGGNKPDHMKHIPDHMLTTHHSGDPKASMTHANIMIRDAGGDED